MSAIPRWPPNHMSQLNKIDVEDLQYVERDLCFYELVSLGFLLFGEERPNAEFVLQKLLVLSRTPGVNGELLRKYASINPHNWRSCLVEALAIIGARRVLRKLGFKWDELRQHYLPHIVELSLHVHPLLKALYKMCERMTPAQAGRMVLQLNEQYKRPEELLRFYDFAYLEIFLLDWLTRRIIAVGDREANDAEMQVLMQYLKLNEMDDLKQLLTDTINSNAERIPPSNTEKDSTASATQEMPVVQPAIKEPQKPGRRTCELESHECYTVRRDQAGIILIIDQAKFHQETAEEFKHLLPKKKLDERRGTDVDRQKLSQVFSSFGYKPQEFENLNHIDVLHHTREAVKRSFLYDSLIVCILSHGIDGAVYGANSIPISIAEIEQILKADTLQGKPKLLIIQACQKDESPVNKAEKKPMQASADTNADILKAMSTVPGYVSMRHTVEGTWFIQSLCDAVHQAGDKKHLLDILLKVHYDVTNKRGDKNEVMVPLTSFTLTKCFFLPPRDNDDVQH